MLAERSSPPEELTKTRYECFLECLAVCIHLHLGTFGPLCNVQHIDCHQQELDTKATLIMLCTARLSYVGALFSLDKLLE